MKKSLKRNYLYSILLNISRVLFPLITAPYVARVLEPDGIGLFNFSRMYAEYFALFAALGVSRYGVREIAKLRGNIKQQTDFVSELMSLLTISTAICTFLFLISLIFVPQLKENHAIFLVAALGLYTTPFRIDWFFSGREEFGYITFRSLIIMFLSLVCLFLFVHDKEDLLIYVLLNAFTTMLSEVWNFVKMYQLGVHPRFILTGKRHLKPLLILLSSSVAISVYTVLDTLMLGFMKDYEQVGYYNSATHISKAVLPIATSLAAVAMPRLSNYMQSGRWNEIQKLADKSLSVVSFLCFPMAIGIIALAPVFIPLFYGDLFYGAVLPLQIVAVIIIAIGLSNLTGSQILIGLDKDKPFLYSVLSGTLTNFFLNLFLIPRYGASGAAFASAIAEILILCVSCSLVYRYTPVRFHQLRSMLCSLLISLFFFVIIHLESKFVHGWYLVCIFILTASIFYILMQFILRNPAVMMFMNTIKHKIINHE